jgi:predicted nucleic acid-binding protein
MKHLLDVNILIAGVVITHPQHAQTAGWIAGKSITLCPLSELGFLRVMTNPRTLGFTMADARRLLENFAAQNNAGRISDDLEALESHPRTSGEVTDHYLADLAQKHGMKLATLDAQLNHPSAQLVPA